MAVARRRAGWRRDLTASGRSPHDTRERPIRPTGRGSAMGDRACDRAYCPACDAPVTVVDEECPDCGAPLDGDGTR